MQVLAALFDPLTIRARGRNTALQLFIINDAALLEVDKEHLTRLQTPLFVYFFLWEGQHAHFRSEHNDAVIGDLIACRTQTVTVQRGADHTTIGEGHGSWAVPRLHHSGVVFIERTTLFVHQRVFGPGFRNQHHHGLRHRIATHDQ